LRDALQVGTEEKCAVRDEVIFLDLHAVNYDHHLTVTFSHVCDTLRVGAEDRKLSDAVVFLSLDSVNDDKPFVPALRAISKAT